MKIKILSMALIVAIAATGCLKNDDQPPVVDNTAAIKTTLVGSWTGNASNIAYYDAFGSENGSATVPLVNLKFDSQGNLTETTTGATPTTIIGTYAVDTDGSGDYFLVTSGAVGTHAYLIGSFTASTFSLSEQLPVSPAATITINNKSITYYSTVQVSSYIKAASTSN